MSLYYSLIAGLPALSLEMQSYDFSLSSHDLFLLCRQELSEADLLQVRRLFLFNDIRNCVFFTFYTKQRREDFAMPSYYDEHSFMALRENPGSLLPFMTRFYENRQKDVREYPSLPHTDELTGFFYQDLEAVVPPGFLRDYLSFYLELRNIASALAFRKSGLPISTKLVPAGLAYQIICEHEHEQDFGLSREFPWVLRLQDVLETASHLEFEMAIDRLLWQWLDEQLGEDFFSLNAVLAYFVRLASVERWRKLTETQGRAKLDDILDKVQRSIRFSMEFNKTGDR